MEVKEINQLKFKAALSFGCLKIFWGLLPLVCQLSLTPLSPRKRTTVPTAEEIKQPLKSNDGENGGDDADDNTICMSTTTTERRRRTTTTTTAENHHMHNNY